MESSETSSLLKRIAKLNEIGIALSAERDTSRLLEMILRGAIHATHADGGTLYSLTDDDRLRFEILHNTSLHMTAGGTTQYPVDFEPIPLYTNNGEPNNSMVAAYAALEKSTVNITDAYEAQGFDFSGTMEFDRRMGYRSKSFLTIPMMDHGGELLGVLQLINAIDPVTNEVVSFSPEDQQHIESLASQAAVALTRQRLLNELRELLEKFIEVIAMAIDEKSPYTGGHCRRVPELAMMLTEAACNSQKGSLKDFQLSESQFYEMKIAGLLHDCGKISTPVHVVDKATKLETIFDRINLLDTRFEVVKRDERIALQEKKIAALKSGRVLEEGQLEAGYAGFLAQLEDDRKFLHHCNIGREFMVEAHKDRVRDIAERYKFNNTDGKEMPFLTEDEIYNLCIPKGTLTAEDREIVNHHIVMTIKMLESLPFPKHLKNIPKIAGGHHERMDGKGYPRGLTGNEMPVQAKIMAIADIFEALTAADRPYKEPMTLSMALDILGKMKLDSHIDPELFDVFIQEKIYQRYADDFLQPEQIDEVDLSKVPGYSPQELNP